jgi:EAL domain-containing protein (putative c-di-GMP-specific phosphodiesterase class I)
MSRAHHAILTAANGIADPAPRSEDLSRFSSVDTKIGFLTEPVISLGSRKYALYQECQARTQTPDGMIHTASTFIPYLERCGAIGDLDWCVLVLTLAELEAQSTLVLSCNVSPQTLADSRQWARIVGSITAHREVASRLIIEISETPALQDIPRIVERLLDVKALGCRLAIDEFGARHWMPFPLFTVETIFDMVKIDRSFLKQRPKTPSGSDNLLRVISLAQCLSPIVIANGVQTAADLAAATTAGATHGQGNFFSRAGQAGSWRKIDAGLFPDLAAAFRPADARPAPAANAAGRQAAVPVPSGIMNRLLQMMTRLNGGHR